ncbi:MAG: HAD hydrolase-like protein [Halobacteriota archaeon]
MVTLTRFCWRRRPLTTAYQKVVVGDRMYVDRQMAHYVVCDFICVLSGETTLEQIDELRAEEFPSLIVKDFGDC